LDRSVESLEKRKRHIDRITLNEHSLKKLTDWLSQIENQNKGINLNKNTLINWLLRDLSSQLSHKQLNELQAEYLDPVKQAKEALKEARAAKARGERVVLKIEVAKVDDSPKEKKVYKKRTSNPDAPLSFKEQRIEEDTSNPSEVT
jgi:DNA repair ATPase RecN